MSEPGFEQPHGLADSGVRRASRLKKVTAGLGDRAPELADGAPHDVSAGIIA